MKITTTSSILAIACSMLFSTTTQAFTTNMLPSFSRLASLQYSVHDEDKPIQCYLIQTDDNEGIPQIVCTSNPEEYAWFHGLDSEQLLPTDGATHDEAVQCVEDESPRGVPEWECESAFQ